MLVSQLAVALLMLSSLLFFFYALRKVAPHYASVVWVGIIVQIAGALVYSTVLFEAAAAQTDPVMSLETRYVYWMLTTPFLVAIFPLFLRARAITKALLVKLAIADLVMLAGGYVGEAAMAGPGPNLNLIAVIGFGVGLAAYVYLIFEILVNVSQAAVRRSQALHNGLFGLSIFLAVGWSIYPIAYVLELFVGGSELASISELVFVFGNLVNKLLLSILAASLALRLSAVGEFGKTEERAWGDAQHEPSYG